MVCWRALLAGAGAKLCFVPVMASASGGTKEPAMCTASFPLSTISFTSIPRVPLSSPGTHSYNSLVPPEAENIPPEAENITGTKQSFAPAPASNARQHTITRQPVIIT